MLSERIQSTSQNTWDGSKDWGKLAGRASNQPNAAQQCDFRLRASCICWSRWPVVSAAVLIVDATFWLSVFFSSTTGKKMANRRDSFQRAVKNRLQTPGKHPSLSPQVRFNSFCRVSLFELCFVFVHQTMAISRCTAFCRLFRPLTVAVCFSLVLLFLTVSPMCMCVLFHCCFRGNDFVGPITNEIKSHLCCRTAALSFYFVALFLYFSCVKHETRDKQGNVERR